MRSNAAVAAVVGVVVSVCAGSSQLAGEGPGDACSLLTQARVGAALGVSVGAGQHLTPSSQLTCVWSQPTDPNHSGKRAVLEIIGPVGRMTPADRFTTAKTPVSGITKTPVTGVGDEAIYLTTPGVGTGLDVKKGSSVILVRVYGFPLDQIKTIEKALAQDALTTLKP
jgi:hypothetical protein